MPRYPSQAEILVDRIHGFQQLFPKYIGTLSPRIVLRKKRKEGGDAGSLWSNNWEINFLEGHHVY